MSIKKKTEKPDPKKSAAGRARALVLSPERKKEIAKQGAVARWGERATHKGNFQEEFGIDVECYVLDDEQKTAVISQRGMGVAIGLSEGGSKLPAFLKGERISPHVGRELAEKLANPLIFKWIAPGANTAVHGYDVTILIDVCKVILAANESGVLQARHQHIVKQAHVILNASAKAGIKGLVYALAGYDATRAEVVAAFKFYVREEAREYEREFPEELYAEWYRLYGLLRPDEGRPWKFKSLTVNHVYRPLAKSGGKILTLTQDQRTLANAPSKKLHQFLSEIGVKALRMHLGRLLGMAQLSTDRSEYERHVERIFGSQLRFDW